MKQKRRPMRFDAAAKRELWRRWKAGETLASISSALSVHRPAIRYQLLLTGGIEPNRGRRSCRALSLAEREEISRGLSVGESFRRIGCRLGRPASTISREVARSGGRAGYRATAADAQALLRAQRPKLCKLAQRKRLRQVVGYKLSQNWSPQQIAGWLTQRFPDNPEMQVSHETIYRTLFVQARGALKKELQAHLRTRRTMRRPQSQSRRTELRAQIPDAVSIRDRPAEVEDRAVPGHWEGDLLAGVRHSYIATLVERQTRFVMLVKLENKETATVVAALKKQIGKLPDELKRSLTWDRGLEMAAHRDFTVATDVDVFFCDPASPWQRGSNENTNGLLRQYFPKGKADLRTFSQADLNKVARQLNERPRQTLNFRSPAEALQPVLQ